jgi:hypothetical protein
MEPPLSSSTGFPNNADDDSDHFLLNELPGFENAENEWQTDPAPLRCIAGKPSKSQRK